MKNYDYIKYLLDFITKDTSKFYIKDILESNKSDKEISEYTESMIEKLQEMKDVATRLQYTKTSYDITLVWKRIEDGIIDNIDNVNNNQLNIIMNNYKFNPINVYMLT
jgi:UDP-2,3-diacylglucosamine pyrophosphatase LpxH